MNAADKDRKNAAREANRRRKAELRREAERLKAARAKAKRESRQRVYRAVRKRLKNDPRGFEGGNVGFLPRVQIEVSGDSTSALSRLLAAGIGVTDVQRTGQKTRFKIRKKDLRKVIAILGDMCYNFKVGKTYGIGRTCAFLLSRIGLFIGAGAAVLCLNICYSYVWRIRVSGNDRLSAAAIESALASCGYRPGLKKRDIDRDEVAAAVSRLPGISDASAELAGTTLTVYVLEADEHEERQSYSALCSAFDATVTRIVLRRGRALVSRGDVVTRGRLLADGNAYSTAGELMFAGECDGEVYGNVSITVSAEISGTAVEYRPTGKTERRTGISLFGFELFDTSSPFESYESEVHTANYDVLLPVYVTSYTYRETAPVTAERDIKAAAEEFARSKAREMGFTCELTPSYTIKPTVSGLYRVNVFLSGEALISRGADAPQA